MELNHSILKLNISEMAHLIKTKEISPVELAQFYLNRIHQFNYLINAYITICDEHALAQAKQAENEILHGNWRGLLHGIPYGVKDVIDTKDILTTHGSSFFRKNIPTEDANCIKKLNTAGASCWARLSRMNLLLRQQLLILIMVPPRILGILTALLGDLAGVQLLRFLLLYVSLLLGPTLGVLCVNLQRYVVLLA